MQASGGIGFFLAIGLYLVRRSLRLALGFRSRHTARHRGVLYSSLPGRAGALDPGQTDRQSVFTAFHAPEYAATCWSAPASAVVATFGYQGAMQWVPSWIAAMLHAQGTRAVIPQVSLITDDADHRRHHRLSVHADDRRALGQKRRAVYLLPRRALLRCRQRFCSPRNSTTRCSPRR